jgi:hypothetical protein
VGRKVNCPECKTGLRVELVEREGSLTVRRLADAESESFKRGSVDQSKIRSDSKISTAPTRSAISRIMNSRLTVACLLALGAISFFAVLMFNPRIRVKASRPSPMPRDSDSIALAEDQPKPVIQDSIEQTEPQPSVDAPDRDSDPASVVESDHDNGKTLDSSPSDPPDEKETPPEAEAPIRRPPEKVDVEGKMAQKIVSYKQPAVSRIDLIEALQEQLGVPIRFDRDELGPEKLDEKIAFELENTTIGDVIRFVAERAGWQVVIEDTGIRLSLKSEAAQP